MTPEAALAALRSRANIEKAAEMAVYHKVPRKYLGIANPVIDSYARDWRKDLDVSARVALAKGLWATNIHEARIAAAKLLTQARIRPDEDAWALITTWVPTFDAWAVADHASIAGQKRLSADPTRLDTVETWTQSDHMWSRRAALVMTLPWAKLRNPKPVQTAERKRILGWAAGYTHDQTWFIQKAVAWWIRDLSKHDADAAATFLKRYAKNMKMFARREAAKYLDASVIQRT